MNNPLNGISGRLFPGTFLSDRLLPAIDRGTDVDREHRQWLAWWSRVAHSCGPATGVRTLFDVAAMPLFARLGFRARLADFGRDVATARLDTPLGRPVGLHLRAWADRSPAPWRDAAATARSHHAEWCFVFAPPYLSLTHTSGHAIRRSVDFTFPAALDPPALLLFRALGQASSFDAGTNGDATLAAWLDAAAVFQDRVRGDLQAGVAHSLGALAHVVARGRSIGDRHVAEALTLVYRVLFLFFAESRDLVPRHHPAYRDAYTLTSLCHDAVSRDALVGLWDGLAAITRLARRGGEVESLRVFPFNGQLFARRAAPSLEAVGGSARPTRESRAQDEAMRSTLVALGTRREAAGRVPISYADLGVEELGAIYERVLDLDPASLAAPAPERRGRAHSARRKETGTFYTPQPLADFLVRRTLSPLVTGASSDRLLTLRIVDPAMGSGAFLVSALRYLSAAYERALVTEGRISATDLDEVRRAGFRRRIAQQCLFGVDANPVAVQVARLSLWLATLAPTKPLGFLDHRLRVGNSLLGASPDDVCREVRSSKTTALPLFDPLTDHLESALRHLARPLADLVNGRDDTVDDVRRKEALWARLCADDSPASRWRLAASLWCARWFWPAGSRPPSDAETRAAIDAIIRGQDRLGGRHLETWTAAARASSLTHQFFHWPLEFPDVFYDATGRVNANPGFDAIIGNPPWEMVRRDSPGEHGASRQPLVRFVRHSGLFPSCDHGQLNLYQPFVDRALSLARRGGRVGLVLPWGLATDDGATKLRRRLLDETGIDALIGLDNSGGIFPVHRGLRFLALTTRVGSNTGTLRMRCGLRAMEEIETLPDADAGEREELAALPIQISRSQLSVIGGRSLRIPDVRRAGDFALCDRLFGEYPALGSPKGWAAEFGRELNATDDRASFGTSGLPVIEGKHLEPFSVSADRVRQRITPARAHDLLADDRFLRPRLAYRDVSAVSNRLALIAAIVPAKVVTTHTVFCLRTSMAIERQHFLCGLFNSYVLNAIVRMLMGGHVTTSLVEQLPVPAWSDSPECRHIARLSARLSSQPHARDVAAELQATVARSYGLSHTELAGLLEGFPQVDADDRARIVYQFSCSSYI